MLHSFNHIRGYAIHASDGEIGSLRDLYFDDQSTLVRYFVIDTGTWLPGKRVLLAPAAVGGIDAERGEVVTGLTRRQVEDGPSVETERAGIAPAGAGPSCVLWLAALLGRAAARRQSGAVLGPSNARAGVPGSGRSPA